MNARLEGTFGAALARLGAPGVLALGVLAFLAAFHVLAMRPAQAQLEARGRAAQPAARGGALGRPVALEPRAARLERFYALFPPSGELPAHVEQLLKLAAASGLQAVQGDYRFEPVERGMGALHVSLPVRGDYAAVRTFVSLVLKDLAIASIDSLRFERRSAADTQLDAQIQLTLYFRPMP